jgi:DMSO reductase family type II enzyme heme b subunit
MNPDSVVKLSGKLLDRSPLEGHPPPSQTVSQSAQPLDVMLSKAKHLAFARCYEDEILRLRLRMTLRRPRTFALLITIVIATTLAACQKAEPPLSDAEVKAVTGKTIPSAIEDKIWEQVPFHPAKLLMQDVVEPRLMQASTSTVRVQAVTDGQKIAFRLSWNDPTQDDLPGPGRFEDAAAVQLPAKTVPDVPNPQMGEDGKPVEITYWSANFQAMVNGRKDDITAIYPQAKIDHYPFEAASLKAGSPAQQEMAKRYAPARSLGNPMSGPRNVPVQDLIAEGPGTLRPADKTISTGVGKHSKDGWTVLLIRPLPKGAQIGTRTQVAFAVWEGSHQEVGSRKMRSGWIPLALGGAK